MQNVVEVRWLLQTTDYIPILPFAFSILHFLKGATHG